MSTILKVDIIREIAMTSTPCLNDRAICDLLYNQCINNTLLVVFYLSHASDKGMHDKDLSALVKITDNLVWYARKKDQQYLGGISYMDL